MKKVVIVGAGLVGCLKAIYLARDGFHVEVYEKYSDQRDQQPGSSWSINLTMSHRGEKSLQEVGLLQEILLVCEQAEGRCVWEDGRTDSKQSLYGERGETIKSLNRHDLNVKLINFALELNNVKFYFNHELIRCYFDEGTVVFIDKEDGKTEKPVSADLFIGADGAHSAMRTEMLRQRRLDRLEYKQFDHYYIEMHIPGVDGVCQLKENRLHAWPKDSYLLIFLPNPDKSFSGILVMPKSLFDEMLQSNDSLITFFRREFNQVFDLIGERRLVQHFQPGTNAIKPNRIVSVKCAPYHASSSSGAKFVLLGDAAHAMVPFYGMGMNTGFEDVQIFHQILTKHPDDISAAIEEFSQVRCKDGHAITELSHQHYEHLCSTVKNKDYNFQRHIDSVLHWLLKGKFVPEYTQVVFSSTPFSECIENCKKQEEYKTNMTRILLILAAAVFLSMVFGFCY